MLLSSLSLLSIRLSFRVCFSFPLLFRSFVFLSYTVSCLLLPLFHLPSFLFSLFSLFLSFLTLLSSVSLPSPLPPLIFSFFPYSPLICFPYLFFCLFLPLISSFYLLPSSSLFFLSFLPFLFPFLASLFLP